MTSSTSSTDEVGAAAAAVVANNGNTGNRFMNWFWDLASDDTTVRAQAGTMIIKFLQQAQKQQPKASAATACADLEYGLKRLVRGLSSSRLSARQGFAACLCEVLTEFGASLVPTAKVLRQIDDTTQVTGAMKGSEERDALFGRLFGYVALVRAGRLAADKAVAVDVFDRLLELFDAKAWFQEAVCEGILSAYASFFPLSEPRQHAWGRLAAVLQGAGVEDMTAPQLILIIGLQAHAEAQEDAGVQEAFRAQFPYKPVASLKKMELMDKTLIASCSGFPKIHRVWHYLMSGVLGMDAERNLPTERLSELTSTQTKALHRFVRFLDAHLLVSTQEKRGVAFALFVELAQRVPASLLPAVLTQALVRCIVATRGNKKHTLFAIAGQTLDAIAKSATDAPTRMAIAGALIQHGSPAFDARCGCQTVGELLAGLDAADVINHVVSVCGIIGSSLAQILKSGDAPASAEEEGAENAVSVAISGVSELAALVKNTKLSGRGEIVCIAVAVLVRLSCFDNGVSTLEAKTATASSKKTPSKKSSKSAAKSEQSQMSEDALEIVLVKHFIEAGGKGELPLSANVRRALSSLETAAFGDASAASVNAPLPRSVVDAASSRLLAAASELGSVSLEKLDVPPASEPRANSTAATSTNAEAAAKHVPFTVLDYCMAVFAQLSSAGRQLSLHGRGFGNTQLETDLGSDDGEEEEDDGMKQSLAIAGRAVELYRSLAPAPAASSATAAPHSRLREALRYMVGQALLHVLTTTELTLQIVSDLCEVTEILLSALVESGNSAPTTNEKSKVGSQKGKAPSNDSDEDDEEDDEDDDGESPQVTLFEACVDLLAVPGEHSVKGIREAIRRLWSCLAGSFTIDADLVLAVVEFIAGEEGALGASANANNNSGDAANDDDADKEKMEVESEEEEDDEDEEEEEIGLDEDAMFDMLAEDADEEGMPLQPNGHDADDSDDEEGGSGLQHTEEADSALVRMLEMRKQSRKKGLLDAKRSQLLNRTRAIDILEAIVSKSSAGTVVVPSIAPLLQCIRRVSASTFINSLQEGRAFLGRLKAVFESRICKEKFHLADATDSESEQQAVGAIEFAGSVLNCADATVRQLAVAALLTLLRASLSNGESSEGANAHNDDNLALKAMSAVLASNFDLCASKKSSRVPFKLFDDIVTRHMDFGARALLPRLVTACASARTPYIRSESSRLVSVLVKRSKSLSADARAVVLRSVGAILAALAASLNAPGSDAAGGEGAKGKAGSGAAVDQKSKRLRPILELIKDILTTVAAAEDASSSVSIDKAAIDALRKATGTGSVLRDAASRGPAVKRLAEGIFECLDKIPSACISDSAGTGSGKKASKDASNASGKKRKAAAQEEAEPAPAVAVAVKEKSKRSKK